MFDAVGRRGFRLFCDPVVLASILVGIPKNKHAAAVTRYKATDIEGGLDHAREQLFQLGSIIDSDSQPPKKFVQFWKASRSTTHRISSREIRFPIFVQALTPKSS